MFRLLGSVWALVARLRASLYRHGWLQRRRLDRPVVSVGALSVGGAGKTPTAALLASLLVEAGRRPAILSRGYRRRGNAPLLVSSGDGSGPLVDAAEAGDEPFWLASVLPGVVVAVAKKREQAADLATRAADVDLFILDDAYQHLRVARDANLLVVNPEAPFWEDSPMPAGRLRESVASAERADAFLIVGDGAAASEWLGRRFPDVPCFELRAQRPRRWKLDSPAPAADSGRHFDDPVLDPELNAGPAVAFAGIARPQRFFADVEAAGVALVERRSFADHHAFSSADIRDLAKLAEEHGAVALITTEKDSVRLPAELPESPPIHVWGYRLSAAAPEALLDWLTERTERSSPRKDAA